MNNQIPNGYKQTGIGIIPEEWEVRYVQDFANVITGGTPRTEILEYWNGNIKWMSSGELNKKFIYDTEKRITEKGLNNSSAKFVPQKSVLIGLAGQGKTRGTVAINFVGLAINQSIAAISPSHNYITKYLFYNLQNRYSELRKISSGEGGRGGLNKKIIKNLLIPLPPLPEQQAIACVLSDMDTLIEQLDRLIQKKTAIKKGAMQQLLTGQKRLPGFTGKWVRKKLGEVLKYEQPTKYIIKSSIYEKGLFPVLTAGKTFILGYTNEKQGVYKDVPVIIFDDFTTATKYVDFPFKVKSSAMKLLKTNDNNSLDFLYEGLKMLKYPISEGDHKRRWIAEFQNIEIQLPPTLKEQQAIAQILSDMDAEIEALQQEKAKYEKIKQGAMDLLLTGKVRLVKPQTSKTQAL